MKCPQCGNDKLVWDFERGEVVCPYCGLVIDTIYYDTIYYEKSKEHSNNKIGNRDQKYIISVEEVHDINYNSRDKNRYKLDIISRDKNLEKVYKDLENLGIFSGRRAKFKLIMTIYFSNNIEKYKKYLENLGISKKDYMKTLRKMSLKDKVAIIAKLREDSE